MAKRSTPEKKKSGPHTSAWRTFEQNLDSISHMLALGRREMIALRAQAARMVKYVEKVRELEPNLRQDKLTRSVQRFAKTFATRVERFQVINQWQIVALVTCVEAYLQDFLAAAAAVDSELMAKSEQRATYSDIIEATALDVLGGALRTRWARNWLSEGGPPLWIRKLEKMGARGYGPTLGRRLELFWGIRHLAVHSAGVATVDFVKRHPGVVKAVGDRVKVNNNYFKSFVVAVREFMKPTEEYFLRRYPSMAAAAPIPP